MASWWVNSVAVASGGAIGALGRFWLGNIVEQWQRGSFPFATMLINVSGSFVLGLLSASVFAQTSFPHWLRLAIGVGVLGAFTTFSTFSVETVRLFAAGQSWQALANVGGNLFGCLIGAALGFWCARWLS